MRDNVLINLVPETMLKNVKAEDPWLKNDHFDVKIKAAVRVGNWKLLTGQQAPEIWYAAPESDQLTRHGSDDRIVRLYNIAEDPTESNNLADSRPAKVLECLKKLEEYRSKVLPILDTPSISDKIAERLMPNHVLAPWDRHNKKMHF
ncbi:arylsulfatase I-like [Saccoglossus kowalevskii]